jgi:heme exporter protein B
MMAAAGDGERAGEPETYLPQTAPPVPDGEPGRATPARVGRPRYLRQLGALVWKDLVVELRSRQRLIAMAAFTVLVGVLFNFALDQTLVPPQDVAAGLIWMTLVFAGLLGVGRTFQLEAEDGAFAGVLLSPLPKDALYLGKVAANFLLVMVVVLLLLGVFGLFFSLDYGARPFATVGVVALGALGFVALTTLFAAVSSATSMGETLLPVLVFPLLVPMIVYGASSTGALLAGRPFSAVEGNVRMLAVFTLVSLLAGAILFRHVVEE